MSNRGKLPTARGWQGNSYRLTSFNQGRIARRRSSRAVAALGARAVDFSLKPAAVRSGCGLVRVVGKGKGILFAVTAGLKE